MSEDNKKSCPIFTIHDLNKKKKHSVKPENKEGLTIDPVMLQKTLNDLVEKQNQLAAFWSQVNLNVHNINNDVVTHDFLVVSMLKTMQTLLYIINVHLNIDKEAFAKAYEVVIKEKPEKEILELLFKD